MTSICGSGGGKWGQKVSYGRFTEGGITECGKEMSLDTLKEYHISVGWAVETPQTCLGFYPWKVHQRG